MLPLIVPIEILSQFMRLISLSCPSLREHARGPHPDPHVDRPDLHHPQPRPYRSVGLAGASFYIFEVVIVVTIQAFIFAALSAIYIGSAIEPEH